MALFLEHFGEKIVDPICDENWEKIKKISKVFIFKLN